MKIKNNSILVLLVSIAALSTTLCSSCSKTPQSDEPVSYTLFFTLKNRQTGNDFFLNNPTYRIKNIRGFVDGGVKNILNIDSASTFKRIEWGSFASRLFYFDYGNNDVDTIRNEWFPATNTPDINKINEIKIYFNGTLVKHFDFANNPSLRTDMINRNNIESSAWANNPIVVELQK